MKMKSDFKNPHTAIVMTVQIFNLKFQHLQKSKGKPEFYIYKLGGKLVYILKSRMYLS